MTIASPRVTVVLTTYNSQRFIREQLRSILSQSRPVDELVIADDASTDDTAAVVAELLSESTATVHAVNHDTRVGYLANVESAASRATGDVVFFADHDDVWHRDKVDEMLPHLLERPRTLAFTNGRVLDAREADSQTDLWGRVGFRAEERDALRRGDGLPVLLQRHVVTGATMACTRDLLDLALPFPKTSVHDHWLSLVAVTNGNVVPLDSRLVDYRVHDDNAVGLTARNPLERLRARARRHDVPDNEADTLQALLNRDVDVIAPSDRQRLTAAIAHHRRRANLPDARLPRAVQATREFAAGGYRHHHASAARSWFFDVVRPTTKEAPASDR